jgi:hypothetical protein
MLPAAMRRGSILALLLTALVAAVALAACGGPEPGGTEANEGEPIVLGDVSYNVGITRFLNPDDEEDSEYLAGLPPAESGTYYLGVFIVLANESDEPSMSADRYTVIDTLDTEYEPVSSESPYALDVGAEVPGDGQLPVIDTAAQTAPNQSALLIFKVDDDVGENRPLELEVESADGKGEITLDI